MCSTVCCSSSRSTNMQNPSPKCTVVGPYVSLAGAPLCDSEILYLSFSLPVVTGNTIRKFMEHARYHTQCLSIYLNFKNIYFLIQKLSATEAVLCTTLVH